MSEKEAIETINVLNVHSTTELQLIEPVIDYVQVLYDTEMSYRCTNYLTSLTLLKRYKESLQRNHSVNINNLINQ